MKIEVLEVLFIEIVFVGTVFVISVISSLVMAESSIILPICLTFFQYNLFHTQDVFFLFLKSHQHISLFYFWFELFLPSNLHFYSHDMCLVYVFDLFISVIISKMLEFKSSVFFGTQIGH